MKLLIAADIFPPESGGPATYCVKLANELVNQGGVEVVIVSHIPESDKTVLDAKVKLRPVKNKFFPLRYWQYFNLLIKYGKNADVIYAMGPVNAGLPSLVVSKLLRKKFVVKVVGDYAWEQGVQRFGVKDLFADFQMKSNHSLWVRIVKFVQEIVVRCADEVIVPSGSLKNIVEVWGARKEKIKLIHNEGGFVVGDVLQHDNEKWIVSVVRLVPWKGVDTLIEVIPEVIKQIPNVKLKIVGDGPEMDSLKLKVKNLQLENVVELTGNLSHNKTLAYIASANLFVLNSGYEGLSHVIVEAMNQGTPVIASSAGWNVEMVAPEGLFEYNNKEQIVKQILSKIDNERGSKIPHIFGGLSMVEKTKQALTDLITNKPINQ